MPDAAVAADDDGRIRATNRLAADLFGFEVDQLVGTALDLLVPERLRHVHQIRRRRYTTPRTIATGAAHGEDLAADTPTAFSSFGRAQVEPRMVQVTDHALIAIGLAPSVDR